MGTFLTLSASAAVILLVICRGLCVDIIGGATVKPHSRPYMALIQGAKRNLICGGALIKEDWVLTAAHCKVHEKTDSVAAGHYSTTLTAKNYGVTATNYPANHVLPPHSEGAKVILGAHSQKAREREKQLFKIAKQIRHPCYDSESKENDIMLVQLHKRAKLTKAVNVIDLPTSDDDPIPGTTCTVAGWGKTHMNLRKVSDTLREVNVTVIKRQVCNDKKHYGNNPVITNKMICAGDKDGGKDSCQGDSGGPLRCNNVMTGITAFGKPNKCGTADGPGVYTRLTKQYVQWIRKTIGGA